MLFEIKLYGNGDVMRRRQRLNGSLCVAFSLGLITGRFFTSTIIVVIIAVLLIIAGITANSRC